MAASRQLVWKLMCSCMTGCPTTTRALCSTVRPQSAVQGWTNVVISLPFSSLRAKGPAASGMKAAGGSPGLVLLCVSLLHAVLALRYLAQHDPDSCYIHCWLSCYAADFTLPPIHAPRAEAASGNGTPVTAMEQYPSSATSPDGYARC